MSGIVWTEANKKSNGGTELMARELEKRIAPDLLGKFQIFLSHIKAELDPDKIRILWAHNLPCIHELKNGGWSKFHKIVFVSDWQMQEFISYYKIPWSRCHVLQNAITPIPLHQKPKASPIRLIYTPTPFRGLSGLYIAFDRLCKEYHDVELSVFSSFNLYGEPHDVEYESLFNDLKRHPKIDYHKTVNNDILRDKLKQSHIFAYPANMQETSCLCLIEAMSAGLLCVHPRYGALAETAANWTLSYQWQEDCWKHVDLFYEHLKKAIHLIRDNDELTQRKMLNQAQYMANFYNWGARAIEWELFLKGLLKP